MYLKESFETILKEYEIDLIDYAEAISNVDAYFWQRVTKTESMYLNKV